MEIAPVKTVTGPSRSAGTPVLTPPQDSVRHHRLRDGIKRDPMRKDLGVFCVDMEVAGLMDEFFCVMIRPIGDHAGSHKNKRWQPYTTDTGAAYAKGLLSIISVQEVAAALDLKSRRSIPILQQCWDPELLV